MFPDANTHMSALLPNKQTPTTKGSTVIIGGGIVGLMAAYNLARDGWAVTVLDKGNFADNCSRGNAGMIVPSHFTPMAAPGVVAQGIKWMFDNRSPFYVKPTLSRSLVSWGLKFLKHANERHVAATAPHILALNRWSKELYTELASEMENPFGLTHRGILMLYKTEKTAEEELHLANQATALGLNVETLNATEVQLLEPNTRLDVLGATHYRDDSHLNPNMLIQHLKKQLHTLGVNLVPQAEVIGFIKNKKRVITVQTAKKEYQADIFILSGGAWLPAIAKLAGLRIPLMPGKGYSFQTSSFNGQLQHPALLLEARVAITPMGDTVRIGGTMELAAINHRINKNRVEGIVQAVPEYYPDHHVSAPAPADTWHGFRPCSPDGLPYLGAAKTTDNLIIAGGMGMMGLSLAAAAGKIVSQLANETPVEMDITPFDPLRFH